MPRSNRDICHRHIRDDGGSWVCTSRPGHEGSHQAGDWTHEQDPLDPTACIYRTWADGERYAVDQFGAFHQRLDDGDDLAGVPFEHVTFRGVPIVENPNLSPGDIRFVPGPRLQIDQILNEAFERLTREAAAVRGASPYMRGIIEGGDTPDPALDHAQDVSDLYEQDPNVAPPPLPPDPHAGVRPRNPMAAQEEGICGERHVAGGLWTCTLAPGHDGSHVAGNVLHARTHGADGAVLYRWRNRVVRSEEEDTMAMTAADYNKIAASLKLHKPDVKSGTVGEKRLWTKIVRELSTTFQRSNARFNEERFYAACEYPTE